jgi:uncharacterized ferredoxin-like protein
VNRYCAERASCVELRIDQQKPEAFAKIISEFNGKGMMKRLAVAMIAVAALLLPGAALASGGSSSCQTYNPQTCQALSSTSTSRASTLPFTGIDLGLLVAGGAVLIAAGFVVRRLARHVH